MMRTEYNPDVLTCLANLSNDEVFTPPQIANQMLDLLPVELWSNPEAKFLDPFTKSGVFLREITKRLITGLETQIPDLQTRINHIMANQIYGIAITELTSLLARRSLYCTKNADGEFSVADIFANPEGNIAYENIPHTWDTNGKCIYCGVSKDVMGEEIREGLESHAYMFIHNKNPFENMQFDVIIGNPPYQLSDGGHGSSAMPLYHKFIEQAIKLQPKFISVIIPARWFSGGKGLDEFRDLMLSGNKMRILVDFINSTDCFPGVDISGGITYFLWQNDYNGDCVVRTIEDNKVISEMTRPLKENNADIFIRYNDAIPIIRKLEQFNEKSFMTVVSSRKPFGLTTNFRGSNSGNVKVYTSAGISYTTDENVLNNKDWVNLPKVYTAKAYGERIATNFWVTGKPFLGERGSICTETYLVVGPFASEKKCENVISYMRTRFFRFLVLLVKNTQNAPKGVYQLVPIQNFNEEWTDVKLYNKYNLSDEEIRLIEKLVRPME
ncbi:Eco57I restriction-modification methylase domain-containing protein [Candidatus Kaistella beijingensis]|uniref:Eco57I restriction-modification methylase domain-containing protein n=1 Tax=Candidatus Kaistella beijingensis TaxID=2820270 RepID=UPI001CC73102|nr:Eco57I restriction-modification methylase domain-containing protein [Candidatus Kaistella beijingensis]UBB89347.1 Eco57I restriction-modification methylase domain-containing protein [Candidatus Kaistella beijingensis]